MQNCASEAKLKLFADDTNLFNFRESCPEMNTKSNNLLNNLINGSQLTNSVNIEGTCYSAFSSNRPNCSDYNLIDLKINATKLKCVEC